MPASEQFPAPERKTEQFAGAAERVVKERVAEAVNVAGATIQQAEAALLKAGPKQAVEAQKVSKLRDATDTLRLWVTQKLKIASIVVGIGAGMAPAEKGLTDIPTPTMQEAPPEQSTEETPTEQVPETDPYHSQDILARRFIDAVTKSLNESQPIDSAEVPTLMEEPTKVVESAGADKKHETFAKIAKSYPSMSEDQQKATRKEYAYQREALLTQARFATTLLEKAIEDNDTHEAELLKTESADIQRVVDEMDVAIGPARLAEALASEAQEEKTRVYYDPFAHPHSSRDQSDPFGTPPAETP